MRSIKYLLIIICFLYPGNLPAAEPLKWDTTEIGILSSVVAANAIDCWQTHILTVNQCDDYKEVNSYTSGIFGDRVQWYKSAALKTAVFGPLVYYGCHKWAENHKIRKLLLICLLVVSLEPVIRNEQVGGGVVFNF